MSPTPKSQVQFLHFLKPELNNALMEKEKVLSSGTLAMSLD